MLSVHSVLFNHAIELLRDSSYAHVTKFPTDFQDMIPGKWHIGLFRALAACEYF